MGTRRGRTPALGRTARLIVGALAVAAVVTTSALAGTIVGTARNDMIRGTAGADKLYGRQGNDSLFGMAGADYLNGGAGKDRFSCGSRPRHGGRRDGGERRPRLRGRAPNGRDDDHTSADDADAADTSTAASAAAPPPPPAKAGFFGGFASTGGSVNFVVAGDGRSLSQFRFSYEADCQPPGRLSAGLTYSGTVSIAADGTFSVDGSTTSGTSR